VCVLYVFVDKHLTYLENKMCLLRLCWAVFRLSEAASQKAALFAYGKDLSFLIIIFLFIAMGLNLIWSCHF